MSDRVKTPQPLREGLEQDSKDFNELPAWAKEAGRGMRIFDSVEEPGLSDAQERKEKK